MVSDSRQVFPKNHPFTTQFFKYAAEVFMDRNKLKSYCCMTQM